MNLKKLLMKYEFKRLTYEIIDEIVNAAEKQGDKIIVNTKTIETSKGQKIIVNEPEIEQPKTRRKKGAVVMYPENVPVGRRPNPGEDDTIAIDL